MIQPFFRFTQNNQKLDSEFPPRRPGHLPELHTYRRRLTRRRDLELTDSPSDAISSLSIAQPLRDKLNVVP